MIASLRGTASLVSQSSVVVEVNGVGYLTQVPTPVASSVKRGEEISLLTHMTVREDALTLYGFFSELDRATFQLLLGVGGVGPKLALAVISALGSEGLQRAVATGDLAALTGVPGVGKRSAQRLMVELGERMSAWEPTGSPSDKVAEVREALMGLGYTAAELRDVLSGLEEDAEVEAMVKTALRELARA